jgi:haloalkane dehalogenase
MLGVATNFFLRYYLRTITKKPHMHFSGAERRAYLGPMRDRAVRRHPHDLFRSAGRSRDYLADLEQRLGTLPAMPALLLFGETDGLVRLGWLARFERLFPRHRSVVMAGAHHFPQEYDAAGVAAAICAWWDDEVER